MVDEQNMPRVRRLCPAKGKVKIETGIEQSMGRGWDHSTLVVRSIQKCNAPTQANGENEGEKEGRKEGKKELNTRGSCRSCPYTFCG